MIELVYHLEKVDAGSVAWWIESPDVPGFYAAADSVAEARANALAALQELGVVAAVGDVVESVASDAMSLQLVPA